ncbi:MAG: hypothetical protein KDD19_13665 [Phaeodactylibacter sp.]|nr:hypothetical protein [Phaeodactylibacter sp.]MCB9054076.1 hypothetical protein [Lewinellaceae bacterium]
MQELDIKYIKKLEEIANDIQESEELQQYLDEEEEEYYTQLKEQFEPRIAALYDEVAEKDPLQVISMETVLLEPEFEGMYLPKILGYSVLRGEVDKQYKYTRPQDHFKAVLLAICHSSNFDILRKRIGQSIQMGFAMSSDIWVTNLINSIDNKRVRYFLQSQKLDRYRTPEERKAGYERYQRQFVNDHFHTAEFPETLSDLKVLYSPLKSFIIHRVRRHSDNTNIIPELRALVANKEFKGNREHMEIMVLFAAYFDLDDKARKELAKHFNDVRTTMPEFIDQYLEYMLLLHNRTDIDLDPRADQRLSAVIDKSIEDDLKYYYELMDIVHSKGYMNEEAQDAIKTFYVRYEGLSTINECVRQTIYNYFARLIDNLEVEDYADYFEISKLFPVYMSIFANQHFNQQLKELSLRYVKKLLKRYTDKRGKDYQDIKKFVSTAFQDFGFLKEKEIIEMFKTRRKRKKTAS